MVTLVQRMLSTTAAGDVSQTTPVQIAHVSCCAVLHELCVYSFVFCKTLTCYMMCINFINK